MGSSLVLFYAFFESFFDCSRTATRIIVPFTSPVKNGGILAATRRFSIICSDNAPKRVPSTRPRPPLNDVPPIIAAAIASSSKLRPALAAVTDVMREAKRNEDTPVSEPSSMYI